MGGFNPVKIFSPPKVSAPPPPPPAPAPVGPSDAEVQENQEQERKRRLSQRGRAATILSKSEDTGGLATKKLLGG